MRGADLSRLAQETLESVLGGVKGERRAVMFSGGFDSMLMAYLARRRGAKVTAVTVQFDGFNPLTVAGSVVFAGETGMAHHILYVSAAEFLCAFEALKGIVAQPLEDLDLAVVYAALKNYDRRIAGDTFISGMGSDQWFGNDALVFHGKGLAARLRQARQDQEDHQRVAAIHGCKFVFPFLSEPMLELSQSVPAALKKDKKLLRALAAARAIPRRTAGSELQVPALIRNILVKKYGWRKRNDN